MKTELAKRTRPQRVVLHGSWPRAATATLRRAAARKGWNMTLHDADQLDGAELKETDGNIGPHGLKVEWSRGGQQPQEGCVGPAGAGADELYVLLQIDRAGKPRQRIEVELKTDIAFAHYDAGLGADDIRPIIDRREVNEDSSGELTAFLMEAFGWEPNGRPAAPGSRRAAMLRLKAETTITSRWIDAQRQRTC